jgi:CrcB protein
MYAFLLVASGGALGAAARYALSLSTGGGGWPWATLLANLGGCFLIGCLAAALPRLGEPSEAARLFLGVGVLGGFTTFSAFSLETFRLVERAPLQALAYASVSLCGGLALTALGWLLVRKGV